MKLLNASIPNTFKNRCTEKPLNVRGCNAIKNHSWAFVLRVALVAF